MRVVLLSQSWFDADRAYCLCRVVSGPPPRVGDVVTLTLEADSPASVTDVVWSPSLDEVFVELDFDGEHAADFEGWTRVGV